MANRNPFSNPLEQLEEALEEAQQRSDEYSDEQAKAYENGDSKAASEAGENALLWLAEAEYLREECNKSRQQDA